MTLVVEDGTGLANANCYVGVAAVRTYATNRGVTLDADDTIVSTQIILATDYLESFRDRYKGARVGITQALSWPRQCADLYDDVAFQNHVPFPNNVIPQDLINAQCQLVCEQANGIVLQQSTSGKFSIEETVGPIKTTYSDKIGTLQQPYLPVVRAIMRNLLVSMGPLRNIRG